jgi:hypothetical protein
MGLHLARERAWSDLKMYNARLPPVKLENGYRALTFRLRAVLPHQYYEYARLHQIDTEEKKKIFI